MKAQGKIFFGVIFVFFFSNLVLSSQARDPQKIDDLISLIKQKSGLEIQLDDCGWEWRQEDSLGTWEQGEMTFSDSKWLMYLIHWGPIQVPKITLDYVKKRMLGMWGVKYEFSGKQGETKVSGHDAVWVEAYGTNRSFLTRFIVWNCPQSRREFIADTNYNLRLKTPTEDFEREQFSAKTVCCHEGADPERFPDLTQKFSSEKYGFSFDLPEQWFICESPFYVPYPEYEGIRTKKMGSVFVLPSDQNITVTLKWYPLAEEKEEMVMGRDQKILENLKKEIELQGEVQSIQNCGFESFSIVGKKVYRIWGIYKIKNLDEKEMAFFTGDGIYQVNEYELKEKRSSSS